MTPFIIREPSTAESSFDHPRLVSEDTFVATRAAIIADSAKTGIAGRWQLALTQWLASEQWTLKGNTYQTLWWAAILGHLRSEGDLGLNWAGSTRAQIVLFAVGKAESHVNTGQTFDRAAGAVAAVYDLLHDDLTAGQRTAFNAYLENFPNNAFTHNQAWNDQTTTEHWSKLLCDLACEDHAARYPAALSATQIWADARVFTAYNSLGYEWKDSYFSNTCQMMSFWTLRQYNPALTDAETYDLYTYHLQNAAQLLRQMVIPHPGLTDPVPMKTNQTGYNTTYYKLGLAGAHILWAFWRLPGHSYLAADDGQRGFIADGEADQATLANSEADLLSYLKQYCDEFSLLATTGNNKALNFGGADGNFDNSPGMHVMSSVIPWLFENVTIPATAKTGAAAGIPLVRRWWPGSFEWTTIANSHTIKNSDRSIITYWHKRYFCGNYEGNCHYNGSWQAHRAGPLYGMGGTDSHSIVSRRQTMHCNGTFTFLDDSEWPAFFLPNGDDYDTGGARLAPSAQNRAECLASPRNDFGRVTKWYADADCVALSSDLTDTYNNQTWNQYPGPGNPARIVSFTKEFTIVRRGADGTDRDRIFVYDRIELTESRFVPRLHINCSTNPNIDGVETPYTPHTPPDQSVTVLDWEGLGPQRWDYANPTRIRFDNLTEPATTGTAPTGAVHTVPGDGKTILRVLQPTSITMRKRGGYNAQVLGNPTHDYNGAPWFNELGAWIHGEGDWEDITDANKPARRAYIGPWVVGVLPTALATSHRYLYVADLMDGGDTITESEYAALTCDANSVTARCGASAVVYSTNTGTRSSGQVTLPTGITTVVLTQLEPETVYTLTPAAGITIETANRTTSNTGVLFVGVTVGSPGTLDFTNISGALMTHNLGIGGVTDGAALYRARANQAATIQIEYSTSSTLAGSTISPGVAVVADDDFTGGESFSGLSANQTYYYSIRVNGVRAHSAPFPKFKSCPPAGVATSFRFAPVSCNLGAYGPAFEHVKNEDPFFIMHLGDVIYGNTSDLALLRAGPDTAVYPPQAGLQSFYQPLFAPATDWSQHIATNFWRDHIWDDHEYAVNNEDGDYPTKAINMKAFKEYMVFHQLVNPTQGLWHKFTIAHCEFFVVDVRYQREGGRERYPSSAGVLVTPDASSSGTSLVFPGDGTKQFNNIFNGWYYKNSDGVVERVQSHSWNATTQRHTCVLSRAVTNIHTLQFFLRTASMLDMDFIANGQTDWLVNAMNASTATFKFFCTPVSFNKTGLGWSEAWGGWDSDQMELNYILQHVTATNVITLSGDRHMQALDDGTNTVWPELLSSRLVQQGSQLNGSLWSHGANTSTEGYAVIDVTPTTVSITVKRGDGTIAPTISPQPLVITAV